MTCAITTFLDLTLCRFRLEFKSGTGCKFITTIITDYYVMLLQIINKGKKRKEMWEQKIEIETTLDFRSVRKEKGKE